MAGDDGLEPPNVGIKIRCLTNLAKREYEWWTRQDSNPPPPACKAGALPDELLAQFLMASRQRLELRPRVLETHVLPLHQRDNVLLNALRPMRVIKHTAESGDHNFRSSPRMLI